MELFDNDDISVEFCGFELGLVAFCLEQLVFLKAEYENSKIFRINYSMYLSILQIGMICSKRHKIYSFSKYTVLCSKVSFHFIH